MAALIAACSIRRREIVVPAAASLVAIFVSYLLLHVLYAAIFAAGLAVLSSVMALAYRGGRKFYLMALAVMVALIYVLGFNLSLMATFCQMFAVGAVAGFLYIEHTGRRKPDRSNRMVEVRRDLFQIGLGIIVIAIVLFFRAQFRSEILMAFGVVAAYIYNRLLSDYGRGTKLYSMLAGLERSNAVFGLGAIYAASGALLLLGFVNSYGMLAMGMFALFIADPLATLVGHTVRIGRLLYNKVKGISGTVAFFLVTALFGYFLIGIYALPLAVVFAVVESAPLGVDDNVTLPLVAIIVNALVSLI